MVHHFLSHFSIEQRSMTFRTHLIRRLLSIIIHGKWLSGTEPWPTWSLHDFLTPLAFAGKVALKVIATKLLEFNPTGIGVANNSCV